MHPELINPKQKNCQRCKQAFECSVDNITQCQCFGIKFTDAEKSYIETRFNDCLCSNCLNALKVEFSETVSL